MSLETIYKPRMICQYLGKRDMTVQFTVYYIWLHSTSHNVWHSD